jgi:RNA polymerase sigma-70 factor (family 1)
MINTKAIEEKELLEKIKSGDSVAFGFLYNKYNGLLYLHAYNRLRDREAAKDMIQELFTTLWAKRDTLTINEGLSSYLYKSVRNRVIDYAAHQQISSKYIQSFGEYLHSPEGTTDHLIREKQLTALIEQEIARLPPQLKLVFELSRKEHLSHKEIAERLGLSDQTVRSYIKDALRILRLRLGILTYLVLYIRHYL